MGQVQPKSLNGVVVSGLRLAIKAHGPITDNRIGSASKRVVSGLVAHLTPVVMKDLTDECMQARIEQLERELDRKNRRIASQAKSVRDLVDKCRKAGVL